jgi:uncharacterized protein
MRWRRVRNPDVIDRRGAGGGGLPMGRGGAVGGGLGVVGVILFLAIQLLGGGSTAALAPQTVPGAPQAEDGLRDFSVYVFHDTQDFWASRIQNYQHAKLVLYRGGVQTGCGSATSAVGPFYCPADQRVYLDLSFYGDMQNQLNASGDFAWAYVIAHEMGHHVQQQLGTSDEVRDAQNKNPDQRNELSVRLELQADCYSGVWAKTVYKQLEPGDVEEAMTASRAVGDDRLQKQATGSVDPDSFTHGSSAQRAKWFDRGRQAGQPADCDTFSGDV